MTSHRRLSALVAPLALVAVLAGACGLGGGHHHGSGGKPSGGNHRSGGGDQGGPSGHGSPTGPPTGQPHVPAPVESPGAAPPGPDPSVNLADPVAVGRAYLVAAHTVHDSDAGSTNRRAQPYMDQANPSYGIGLPVLTPPPAGQTTTITVDTITPLSSAPGRATYTTTWRLATGPTGHPGRPGAETTSYLSLAQQPDMTWRVLAETSTLQPADD
ncbi:MAG: hypothetical protein ACJ73S_04735 [Mycobacteriales bacterium]